MKKQQKNKKSGFTLVELVVVIAIIGILAAVITPRVRTSIYKARDAKAVATLDSIRTAATVYFTEKGGQLSVSDDGTTELTKKDMDKLVTEGYLDAVKGIEYSTTGDDGIVLLEVGNVVAHKDYKPNSQTLGKLSIGIDKDRIGLKFIKAYEPDGTEIGEVAGVADETDTTITADDNDLVDTGDKPWRNK